jgi:Uma2 family endonuclease
MHGGRKLPNMLSLCYLLAMTAVPQHRMTADEFLAWAEALPKEAGRFELWDGQVVVTRAPTGKQSERAAHWEAKGALYGALKDAIKRAGLTCFAAVGGASVKMTNDRVVEPDVLVYCGQRVPRNDLAVPDPVVVVEVLSPSSAKHDSARKLDAYFAHPSIMHYLIVDPDKPLVIHHKRSVDGAWMTRLVPSGPLTLDPPGLEVDLTELFEQR